MSDYKLFPLELDPERINQLGLEINLSFNTYLISIVFPNKEICLLSTLQYRFDSEMPWIVKGSNLSSNTGEISIELGSFRPEGKLQLFWIINAISKISSIAIFLGNKESKNFIKVVPLEMPKSIEKGKDWIDEKKDISLF